MYWFIDQGLGTADLACIGHNKEFKEQLYPPQSEVFYVF